VILGILATLGVGQYTVARERQLGKEAQANLKLIRAAERIYRMENATNSYTNCSCSSGAQCNGATGCNTLLRLSLTPRYWFYAVINATNSDFEALADRNATGTYGDCIWSINHTQEDPVVRSGTCAQ
jgi:type II secretory pathway pseudopilin PulG